MREMDQVLKPTVDVLKQTGPSQDKETDSQPEGPSVYEFNLKAQYQDPDNPDEVIDGSSLKTRLNLGRLSSQFQSQRDKAMERIQLLTQQNEGLNQLVEKYKQQEAKSQAKQSTLEAIKELGYKPEQQDSDDAGSSWLPEGETSMTREEALQRWQLLEQQALEKSEETAEAATQRMFQKFFESEQKRNRAEGFVSARQRAKEEQLKADMPLVDPEAIGDIAELYQKAHTLDILAYQQADADKLDEAEAAYAQSQELGRQANKLHAEALNRQAQLAAEQERNESIEMFGPGSEAFKEIQAKRTLNKKDAAKNEKEYLESLKKKVASMKRALSS